jgi:hypothetical protein
MMIKIDTIDEVLRKISKSDSVRLYLGVGNGDELFEDLPYAVQQNMALVGIEMDSLQFINCMKTYNNLKPTLQERIALYRADATDLPDHFKRAFGEIFINYPWNNVNGEEQERGLYNFLSKNNGAADYLNSLLAREGRVYIRIHPNNLQREEDITHNLESKFNIIRRELPDHAASSFGYKYTENQRGPTIELELSPKS